MQFDWTCFQGQKSFHSNDTHWWNFDISHISENRNYVNFEISTMCIIRMKQLLFLKTCSIKLLNLYEHFLYLVFFRSTKTRWIIGHWNWLFSSCWGQTGHSYPVGTICVGADHYIHIDSVYQQILSKESIERVSSYIYIYIYMCVQSDIKSGKNATDLKFFLIESLYLPHDGKNTQKKFSDFFWYLKSSKTDFGLYLDRLCTVI